MSSLPTLLELPPELLSHIFGYVFTPWHLQIRIRKERNIERYFQAAQVIPEPHAPSLSPLLVCSVLYDLVKPMIVNSFSGTINIFESTGLIDYYETACLKCLPPKWNFLTTHVTRLLCENKRSGLSGDSAFRASLANLREVHLFETWGVHLCKLSQQDFGVTHVLEELTEWWPTHTESVTEECVDFRKRTSVVLQNAIMNDALDTFWVEMATLDRQDEHFLDAECTDRNIKLVVHYLFSFGFFNVATGSGCSPDSTGTFYGCPLLSRISCKGLVKNLNVGFEYDQGWKVVSKHWCKTLKAERRLYQRCRS